MSKCHLGNGCAILGVVRYCCANTAQAQQVESAIRRDEYLAVTLHESGVPLIVGVTLAEALLMAQHYPPFDCAGCGRSLVVASADAA